jgi:hypothetical protein
MFKPNVVWQVFRARVTNKGFLERSRQCGQAARAFSASVHNTQAASVNSHVLT